MRSTDYLRCRYSTWSITTRIAHEKLQTTSTQTLVFVITHSNWHILIGNSIMYLLVMLIRFILMMYAVFILFGFFGGNRRSFLFKERGITIAGVTDASTFTTVAKLQWSDGTVPLTVVTTSWLKLPLKIFHWTNFMLYFRGFLKCCQCNVINVMITLQHQVQFLFLFVYRSPHF